MIDPWGRTPEPPLPAFQQVLHGLPAVDYTSRDIRYRPRNVRVHKVYGFSPVAISLLQALVGGQPPLTLVTMAAYGVLNIVLPEVK